MVAACLLTGLTPCAVTPQDTATARIEAHAALILRLVDQKSDITLKEIRAELAERGISAGIGTLWRFFDRRWMTWKKSRRMPRSRTGRTS